MAKADGNVPFIGPRSRYSLVGLNPTVLLHRMAAATDFAGDLPETASVTAANLDPAVSGGKALWASLNKGGLFPFTGKPLVIESLLSKNCTATWTIVDSTGATIRTTPSAPFKLAPNERLKATSTGASSGAEVGVVVRLDAQRVL